MWDMRSITYLDPYDMTESNFKAPFRASLQGDLRRRCDGQVPLLRGLRQLQARERHFLTRFLLAQAKQKVEEAEEEVVTNWFQLELRREVQRSWSSHGRLRCVLTVCTGGPRPQRPLTHV